jgi:hypothetical protein
MTALWVIAAVIVFAGAVLRRMGDQRIQRARRPGEDLPPLAHTPVTDDMVVLRVCDREEAVVILGLIETSGIPVAMRGTHLNEALSAYGRRPATQYRIFVPADRVEEAEALLSEPEGQPFDGLPNG